MLPVEVRGHNDFEGAFAAMVRQYADGVVVLPDPVPFSARNQVARLAARHRLPAMYFQGARGKRGPHVLWVERGSPVPARRVYVDKILRGAKPGDLAVEQPTNFELVINLKTAKALGLTIPQTLLLQAAQVIE